MKQEIEYIYYSKEPILIHNKDIYEFRADKRLHFIQKLCFYILGKIGSFHEEKQMSIKRHVIRPDSFIQNLLTQKDNIEDFFYRKPDTLIIGADDYANLMNEAVRDHPFEFMCNYKYGKNGYINTFGLKVCVIPWMKGMVALHKKMIE